MEFDEWLTQYLQESHGETRRAQIKVLEGALEAAWLAGVEEGQERAYEAVYYNR